MGYMVVLERNNHPFIFLFSCHFFFFFWDFSHSTVTRGYITGRYTERKRERARCIHEESCRFILCQAVGKLVNPRGEMLALSMLYARDSCERVRGFQAAALELFFFLFFFFIFLFFLSVKIF